MPMLLTPRMEMLVSMAENEKSVCDVGTDHGYIAIALAKKGIKVIATDINKGPLHTAQKNIKDSGVNVETRLSDGLEAINEGEADCALIAGMGGELMAKILSKGTKGIKSFILQPQSLIFELRSYLVNNGFLITEERMCREDNRFYTAIKAEKGNSHRLSEAELRIGPMLMRETSPVLKEYLNKETEKLTKAIEKIENSTAVTEKAVEYRRIIEMYRSAMQNG